MEKKHEKQVTTKGLKIEGLIEQTTKLNEESKGTPKANKKSLFNKEERSSNCMFASLINYSG